MVIAYSLTHLEDRKGDLNDLGEDGESVYGEKAEWRLVFGEGSSGDFKAIIASDQSPNNDWLAVDLSNAVLLVN